MADDGAGSPPSTEPPPALTPAAASAGGHSAAAPPAPGAVGVAAAQPASVQPQRPAKPLAARLGQLEYPTNVSSGVVSLLGGAFSFMCVVRMDGFDHWSRVFDFSLEADDDSITAGAIGLTQDLHFTIFRGRKPFSTCVRNFFEPGREFTMMCTVSASGHMRVFKNGALVGENPHGMVPLPSPRPRMIVGGHFKFRDQAFRGSLRDVKVWDQEVSWLDAVRG